MLKKIYCFAALALLTICVGSTVYAQDSSSGTTILKSANGFLFIDNNEDISYSIEFKGNEIKSLEGNNPIFVIDNRVFQTLFVPQTNFLPKEKQSGTLTNEQLLEFHKTWESDYLGKAMNTKFTTSSQIFENPVSGKVMIWSFPVPKELGAQYTHQLFATTIVGKSVLGINTPIEKESDLERTKTYLKDVIKTLKISTIPIDVKKISEELKKLNSGK